MARPGYYQQRNAAAKLAGYKSYGEQRSARRLGYHTAAEFRVARGESRRLPTPAPAAVPLPAVPLVNAAPLGAGKTGYYVDHTDERSLQAMWDAIAGAASALGVRGGAGDPGVRVHIYSGGAEVGKGGWSLSYLLTFVRDGEDFGDFLERVGGGYGEADAGGGSLSVTIG